MQLPSYNAQQRITELRMSTVLKLASRTTLRGPVISQGGRRKANFFPLRSLFLAQESLCHSVSWRQNYFLESHSVPGSRMLPSGLHLPRMLTNACSGRESSRHDTFLFCSPLTWCLEWMVNISTGAGPLFWDCLVNLI